MDHPVSQSSLQRLAEGTSSREENREIIAHLLKGCPSCSGPLGAYLRPEIAADAYDAIFARLSAAAPIPQGGKVLSFEGKRRVAAPAGGRTLRFHR